MGSTELEFNPIGNGLLALLRHPAEIEALRAGPRLGLAAATPEWREASALRGLKALPLRW